ncbi:NAD-dependent deacylase [Nocardioides ganghwensis]|jgi:NAD-dependent deacetylase|uniref:NAD-dependent protein deacylase n=1 Tax=Nocardioides ganghwensis TaxID=252230 RepID=A0A4Q2S812_9ACTN|nr:NAD-dependent deacylase [Nocardioides ganghwensis]MBD3947607.1 NAD-dependent deacylase [Nocardioides ganghwensis]RYB99378.1 NAD-dependent deacylase [Nocardioides ganghwensis]
MSRHQRIVVLTGAGISAESGLTTFRDSGGLWEGHDPMQVATPEAYAHDPHLVQRFYDARRAALSRVEPNAAHHALVRLEDALGDDLLVVTQNVDDLHERAGSRRVHHIHGRLQSAWCTACDARHPWDGPLVDGPPCPGCGSATLRPDVVWFGEVPHGMDVVEQALWECDLFVSIGTSGTVYPAAAFVHWARGHTLELNLEPSAGATDFAESRRGPASRLVPEWVEELLD